MASKEKDPVKKETTPPPKSGKASILTWVIMVVIIGVLSGSGFVLGGLFAKPSSSDSVQAEDKAAPAKEPAEEKSKHGAKKEEPAEKKSKHGGESEKESSEGASPADPNANWYYNDLEPVVVNPDEPGATRFVRVGLTLEVSSSLSMEEATALIELKKPPMINWLNLYFKSLTLDEMKDDRDIQRILSQTCDAFNEILFPDAKPLIKKVLIKEFNIQ
jgi:flagellar basal body-associated protein FliL